MKNIFTPLSLCVLIIALLLAFAYQGEETTMQDAPLGRMQDIAESTTQAISDGANSAAQIAEETATAAGEATGEILGEHHEEGHEDDHGDHGDHKH